MSEIAKAGERLECKKICAIHTFLYFSDENAFVLITVV